MTQPNTTMPALLLVEDDPDLRKLICHQLGEISPNIITAGSGKEALQHLEKQSPDLIILDYTLPDMTAASLIQKIKDSRHSIPFVIITGTGDEKVAVEMMKQGARDYLIKDPKIFDNLSGLIQRHLKEIEMERKLESAEYELKNKNQLLQAILDGLPDFITLQTPDHQILAYNKTASQVAGIRPEEYLGRRCYELLGRNQFCEFCNFDNAKNSGVVKTSERFIERLKLWVECRNIPVMNAQGEMIYMVEQLRDITERKKNEIALRESETRLHQAQALIGLGSWEYSPSTGKTLWSPEMFKIHGLDPTPEAPSFAVLSEMIHPEDKESWLKMIEEVTQTSSSKKLEFRILRPDGDCRWVLAHEAVQPETKESHLKYYGTLLDITERKKMETELRHLATIDPLSEVYNRRVILEIADREFALVKRYSRPLSVLMMDIDFFKSINDNYGHASGDLVLKNVSKMCRKILRITDFMGRVGGEEFLMLLPETPLDEAQNVATRLKDSIHKHIVYCERHRIRLTVSIGIAEYNPSDDSFETLMKKSDKALYKAKNNGRNRIETET